MSAIKTSFLPGKDLFFTLSSQLKLYELYGVKSHKEFMNKFTEKDKSATGLEPTDFINVIYAASLFENKDMKIEEVGGLIDEYMLDGNGQDDLYILLLEAFANSGMTDKNIVEAIKKSRELSPEQADAYLEKIINSRLDSLSKKGAYMGGEPQKNL